MGTRTKKEMVEVEKQVHFCDICGGEIHPEDCRFGPPKCEMCGRDIHLSEPCMGYNKEEDTDRILCKICADLGKEYWALIARQEAERDAAFERWREKCEDHRYDD